MLKRILLSSALLLLGSLHQASHAGEVPAWGLIVKLKADATQQSNRADYANNRASIASVNAQTEATAQTARAQMQAALQRAGLPQASHRALIGSVVHHVGTDQILTHSQAVSLASKLMASGAVEWAVPNERAHLQQSTNPDDSYFYDEWWAFTYSSLDANRRRGVPDFQGAWATSNGTSGPIVAVLDTGITSHGDLDASTQVLPGYDFVSDIPRSNDGNARDNNAADPGDALSDSEIAANPSLYSGCTATSQSSWHGTAVTGVIAAHSNNATGITGANWHVRILPVRVAGKCGAWDTDIIDGMRWAAGLNVGGLVNPNPARIINLSFGGPTTCTPAYTSAIHELHGVGAVVVAAAGNDHGPVTRPASCAGTGAGADAIGVIAVVALNRDGFKANYSNFGPEATIATVGGDPGYHDWAQTNPAGSWGPYVGDTGILTLGNDGTTSPGTPSYYYYAGTSMAAPVVSAALSLMLSVNPNLTADELIRGVRITARPHVQSSFIHNCSTGNPGRCICTTQTCGAGILDANRALQYATYSVNAPASGFSPSMLFPDMINSTNVQAAAATGQDTVSGSSSSGQTINKSGGGGGGGGGSLSLLALLGLGLATALAARQVKAQAPRTA